jgi:uncharacterized protein YjbK
MIPVEIELKWALEPAGHAALRERIAALLGPATILEQENRFFDTADHRLRQARRSVRVRRENQRIVLTCKAKGTVDADGTHRHDEWERELDGQNWTDLGATPLPIPEPWAGIIAGHPLACLGGFANHRLEWHDGPHLLCLDRSDFGSRIDHELEIETPQPAAALVRWRGLLGDWGIVWRPQPVTKLQRWLACAGQEPREPGGAGAPRF